jgi:hypothetical protein
MVSKIINKLFTTASIKYSFRTDVMKFHELIDTPRVACKIFLMHNGKEYPLNIVFLILRD